MNSFFIFLALISLTLARSGLTNLIQELQELKESREIEEMLEDLLEPEEDVATATSCLPEEDKTTCPGCNTIADPRGAWYGIDTWCYPLAKHTCQKVDDGYQCRYDWKELRHTTTAPTGFLQENCKTWNAEKVWEEMVKAAKSSNPRSGFNVIANQCVDFLKTAKDKMSLWGGGIVSSHVARNYNVLNGGMLGCFGCYAKWKGAGFIPLEITKLGKAFDNTIGGTFFENTPSWMAVSGAAFDAISTKFVEQATGEIQVFTRGYMEHATLMRQELPGVVANRHITQVKFHILDQCQNTQDWQKCKEVGSPFVCINNDEAKIKKCWRDALCGPMKSQLMQDTSKFSLAFTVAGTEYKTWVMSNGSLVKAPTFDAAWIKFCTM